VAVGIITPETDLEREVSMVCEGIIREMGRATCWVAVRDCWQTLEHVRMMANGLLAEMHTNVANASGPPPLPWTGGASDARI
jgi:hypothetical protein